MTLNSAFTQVFGDELTKRGFVKLRGSHTYYVRLVNNEIVQFITYMKEKTYTLAENGVVLYAFDIVGGVETVYRPCIKLGKTPNDQNMGPFGNMVDNFDIYMAHTQEPAADAGDKYHKFRYNTDHDDIMIDAFGKVLAVSREYLLPEIEKTDNIKACIDFFHEYNSTLLFVYSDPENIFNDESSENESLLYLLAGDYSAIINNNMKATLDREEKRMKPDQHDSVRSEKFEEYCKSTVKFYNDRIEQLNGIFNNKPLYERVMSELERRRQINNERIADYGLL